MGASTTAAGMKNYKPRRPNVTIDDVVTPEIRAKRKAMMEDAADEAAQPMLEKAHESARTTMKKGGSVSSASSRADGCAVRGKTRA
jgi:prophage antirepressor-like protein